MLLKDEDVIANRVDPDQTAVRSGSALFAQAYLSKNLGSLRYVKYRYHKQIAVILLNLNKCGFTIDVFIQKEGKQCIV